MKIGDTIKVTESDMANGDGTRVVTGKVIGFEDNYVVIGRGAITDYVAIRDITELTTITQDVKKTKGQPSKIGVPS